MFFDMALSCSVGVEGNTANKNAAAQVRGGGVTSGLRMPAQGALDRARGVVCSLYAINSRRTLG